MIPDLRAPPREPLKGITRGTIFDIAKELKVPIREVDMTRYDVWCADECFLTGSGAEVIPVVKLDGREIGTGKPGKITQAVLAAFRSRVLRRRHPHLSFPAECR